MPPQVEGGSSRAGFTIRPSHGGAKACEGGGLAREKEADPARPGEGPVARAVSLPLPQPQAWALG